MTVKKTPEVPTVEVGAVGGPADLSEDRKHYDVQVPPREQVQVAPGVWIFLHRDHETPMTVFHTADVARLVDVTPDAS